MCRLGLAAAAARFAPPSRRQSCCSAQAVHSTGIMCQARSNTLHETQAKPAAGQSANLVLPAAVQCGLQRQVTREAQR